jgi:hypothetical protein
MDKFVAPKPSDIEHFCRYGNYIIEPLFEWQPHRRLSVLEGFDFFDFFLEAKYDFFEG